MSTLFERVIDRFSGPDRFSRSVFTLITGATSALVISYLVQPILTRLYSPDAFGLFDTFASVLGLLIPFASLRYEDAIMLPEDEEEAKGVMALSIAIVAVVTLLSAGLLAADFFVKPLPRIDTLIRWLVWIPPVLLMARLARLAEQWLTRLKSYASISTGQFAQSGVTALSRIAFVGVSQASPLGLIAGYFAGFVAGLLWYGYRLLASSFSIALRYFHPKILIAAARRYRRFPLFSAPSTLLNALLSRLPFLLLLYYFDSEVVGYFGRAYALYAVPLSLIGSAVSQVFFVEGAEIRRTDAFPGFTLRVHERLVMLGIFPLLALVVVGPQLMGFILGDAWESVGIYLRWIGPWLFLAGVASPLTRVFDILERQRSDLLASVLMFTIQTSLLVIGGSTENVSYTLILLGVGGVLARLLHLGLILQTAGSSLLVATRHYIRHGLVCVPFLGILYAVSLLLMPWLTTLAFVICGIGYLYWSAGVMESGSPGVWESGGSGVRELGGPGVRESGSPGVRESEGDSE